MHSQRPRSGREYEVAIVGGGSAGYAAARTTAAAGLRTVVLEAAREVGGLCILRGCMPSKALLWPAEVRHLAQQGLSLGLASTPTGFDWTAVKARKDALIRTFAEERRAQLSDGRFDFIQAHAVFEDPHTVSLSTGQRLTADHFVITTGSVVANPPIPQLRTIGALSSDDAIALESLPASMIIVGGGAVALEFAQLFRRFDVEVILVQRSDHVLSGFDTDVSMEIEAALRAEGVQLFTGTHLLDARCEGRTSLLQFQHQEGTREVRAEAVLVALGRTPNTYGLGLEAAGVALDGTRIRADAQMRTTAAHVYTAGDCTGPHDIVHVAVQQGEIAGHNIAHPDDPRQIDDRLLTKVVFTDPQMAVTGLSETLASRRVIPHQTARHRFDDHGKSMIMGARYGFVKLLADPASGEILGGACVGPYGGELIHEIVAAMYRRMTVHELARMPHYHPTLAEIWTYPAEELAAKIPVQAGEWGRAAER